MNRLQRNERWWDAVNEEPDEGIHEWFVSNRISPIHVDVCAHPYCTGLLRGSKLSLAILCIENSSLPCEHGDGMPVYRSCLYITLRVYSHDALAKTYGTKTTLVVTAGMDAESQFISVVLHFFGPFSFWL